MSPAEKRALKAMAQSSHQDGVIDHYGRVVIDGERTKFAPETWLRLVSRGFVVGKQHRDHRLFLTSIGAAAAEDS